MEEKSKIANQLLSMSKVKSILRLIQQGISKRKIAERCRVSRKTVDKYEEIFDSHPLDRLELLRLYFCSYVVITE